MHAASYCGEAECVAALIQAGNAVSLCVQCIYNVCNFVCQREVKIP